MRVTPRQAPSAALRGIVVTQADRFVVPGRVVLHVAHDHFGRGARSKNQDSRLTFEYRKFQVQTAQHPDAAQHEDQQDAVRNDGGTGVRRGKNQARCGIDQRLAEGNRQNDVAQVPDAGVTPQPLVEAKGYE